jgi:outer membrane lipase/esterase
MLNKLRKGLLASVIGIGFMASTSHAALEMPNPAYTRLVIFGDSLSDSGNNSLVFGNNAAQSISGNGYIPGQTYASGTYSNGPVWATQFASSLGIDLVPSLLGGTNYAYGGSVTNPDQVYLGGAITLPSLVSQASQPVSEHYTCHFRFDSGCRSRRWQQRPRRSERVRGHSCGRR